MLGARWETGNESGEGSRKWEMKERNCKWEGKWKIEAECEEGKEA
jgi:hypothetical protein